MVDGSNDRGGGGGGGGSGGGVRDSEASSAAWDGGRSGYLEAGSRVGAVVELANDAVVVGLLLATWLSSVEVPSEATMPWMTSRGSY